MIIVDNNEMNTYGGRDIIIQDIKYLIHEESDSILHIMHQEIIRELKRRDKDAKNYPSD